MDSKPIAIILGIVITVGAMGAATVYAGNIFSGTSTSTDLIPKTVEIFSIDKDHLEANVQLTNQGTGTLQNIRGQVEVNGLTNHTLTVKTSSVGPYKTLVLSGPIRDIESAGATGKGTLIGTATSQDQASQWDMYPGQSVLLRITAETTSGDSIEKLHEITVR